MLKTFFKNHHLFTQNEKNATKYSGKVCEYLKTYTSEIEEIPQPEFLELLQFVLAVRSRKEFAAKDELIAAVQKFRLHLHLKPNILSTYKSFCNVMKISFVTNEKVQVKPKTNGVNSNEMKVNGDAPHKQENGNGAGKRKKIDSKKEKKLKKQQRMEAASKGFNASFSFTNGDEIMLE